MFLSQPPMATRPSKPSQPATVSMESAITSRDTSEYFIPSVPLAMPSEMVMVLKIPLAAGTIGTVAGMARQLINMAVAGCEIAPGGGDAHLGPGEISIGETHRTQHGTTGRLAGAIHHRGGVAATWITKNIAHGGLLFDKGSSPKSGPPEPT